MKVFIIAAVTADGFIGRDNEHAADWTSPEDKKIFIELTKQAGIMVMGSKTFSTIGRALPGRESIVYTSKEDATPLENVRYTHLDPQELIAQLEAEGKESVAICGGSSIYSQFLAARCVDELYLTIEPVLFGSGVSLFHTSLSVELELIETSLLNTSTILNHYRVKL